jgi:hypothetical protein
MERLTTSIITVKNISDFQAALNKLALYEDAEESGELVHTIREAFYILGGKVLKGRVTEIHIKLLQVEEGPDYELWYDIMIYDGEAKEERLHRGKLGTSVFNSEEDAKQYMSSEIYNSVFKEI